MSTSTPTRLDSPVDLDESRLDEHDTDAAEEVRQDPDDPPGREVVVGVDGSESALGAVRWAAQEAVRRGAPLRIVHAASYLGRPGVGGAPPAELPRAWRITAHAYTVARHTAPGVRACTEVVPGDPATALLRVGATGQLIVVGISTTGAADELILAPVAQRVAARAAQPVVVVPRRRNPEPTGRPVVAVLGLGECEDDEPVATFAAESARQAGVPLTLLQTRTPHHAPGVEHWDAAAWAERLDDLEVRPVDVPGAPASRLLAESCPTPLLVMTAGYGTLFHRNLDGLHRWLLRHCTSPMALVPPIHRPTGDEPREEIIALG